LLEAEGYEPVPDERSADVVVINTCSVRERAVAKLYSRLGEVRVAVAERNSRPIVAVAGCVAQQEGDRLFARDSSVDVVVGTQRLKELPALVGAARESRRPAIDVRPHDDVSFPLGLARHSDPVRAWVTIIEGCNEFCAFCVVPHTRGHERMRPVRDILAEVQAAVDAGRREIQLLGQIVNHYEAPDDSGCDFAELLRRVSGVPGVWRVRFASPHPRHVTERLVAAIRSLPQVCKHLHLPVQSGSDRMLAEMKRGYGRAAFVDLVGRLRAAVPDIAISTDIMVGFCGETEDDHAQTLSIMRELRFDSAFMFAYSDRGITYAARKLVDDVPPAEKKRRLQEVIELQEVHTRASHQARVGLEEQVLVAAASKRNDRLVGRTARFQNVLLPLGTAARGELVRVRISASTGHSLVVE
jgi:tRNA-2-methylthio-N6-dimethylallyladenosine synthase